MKRPLEAIPGVGPRIARVMEALGVRQVSDLRGREAEKLNWWYWKDKAYPPQEEGAKADESAQ